MEKFKVEVWSDIVCPFCYIGKKNYELALEKFEHSSEIELEFKSFQLDPQFSHNPDDRYDLNKGLAEKYNKSLAEIEQMQVHIKQSAHAVGLNFDFENSYRFNTENAHRLLHKAHDKGIGTKMSEAFFSAYLEKGLNLAKPEILKQVAVENGLSPEEVDDALTNETFAYRVQQDMQEAGNLRISGVPFFVFNRKYGVSGAQPVDVFLKTLEQSYEDWKKTTPSKLEIIDDGARYDINGNCE